MSVASNKLRVLVAGAGPAGLLIAHVLKKVGISCTVFEADDSVMTRLRDWNFGIYWAQSPLSDCLPKELAQQLESAQVDDHKPAESDFLPVFNVETGELMLATPAPFSLRLHRRKFLKLISNGVDIRYGKRLMKVNSESGIATATFEDGSVEYGNLLIGAEGVRSVTRSFLLGPERAALIQSPIVATAIMTKLPAEAALKLREMHYRYTVNLHPKGLFTWTSVHDSVGIENPADWEFMILQTRSCPGHDEIPAKGPELVQDIKRTAKAFAQPMRFILESIPDDAPAWHSRLTYWPTQEFDDHGGTVTIIGDAAHPMTYHRGQGLNNAILDVANFLKRLQEMEDHTPEALSKAVISYRAELCERGKEAVLSSMENTLLLHDWTLVKTSPLFRQGVKQN